MSQFFEESPGFELIKEKSDKYMLDLFSRAPVSFRFAQGHILYDTEGKQYIDFLSGISVTNLGHGDADIVQAIRDQAERIVHSSNLFYLEQQANLAEALISYTFPGRVFFTNSGAESNEAAFKLVRSYGQQKKDGAERIVSMQNSFHGRTLAGMCLTGQKKIHDGFGKLLDGHEYLPFNDIDLLEKEFEENGHQICGLFIEPILGEGGIHVAQKEYLLRARELCYEYDVVFVLDEIQTGMGRTGKLWAYEHYGIVPDVLTISKAFGSGFPIGAIVVADDFCAYLVRGQHGSTFSGNHLACIVAWETLRILHSREIFSNVNALSEYFFRRLGILKARFSCIKDIRGIGLHIGFELIDKGSELVNIARENGLLINCTADNTIRLMPPLNINLDQAAAGLDLLEKSLGELKQV